MIEILALLFIFVCVITTIYLGTRGMLIKKRIQRKTERLKEALEKGKKTK